MGAIICSCGDPRFGNLGRPNCVIEMKAVAFPIIVPRYKADGVTRNTINVMSPTLGQDIRDMIQASNPATERIYPFPRCENITYERSETVSETAPSTRKYKIDGVGGVYTMNLELWGKEAAHQILRELKKYGCTEVDVFMVTVDGNIWGIKDDINGTELRGYEMATETFDAFKEFASDTTTQKLMVSFDFDNQECLENSYAITAEEMVATGGVKGTDLRGLVSAYQTPSALADVTLQSIVYTGFGSAGVRGKVVGLLLANFSVYNETTAGAVAPSAVNETADGTYEITIPAQTAADVLRIDVANATGHDVESATVAAL